MCENRTLSASMIKEGLSAPEDQEYQYPVNYAYNYLQGRVEYLVNPKLKLNDSLGPETLLHVGQAREVNDNYSDKHSIDLFPIRAGLPWPSGILICRQNKYWQLTIDTTRSFLFLLAKDEVCQEIFKSGHSVAEIARKELRAQVEEGWAKFPAYLFPDGDRQRTRLLAIVTAFIIVFDDFWEMHDIQSFSRVQTHFMDRMRGDSTRHDTKPSLLKSMIDETLAEIRELDRISGNTAGQEMIDFMVASFTRTTPPEGYNDLEEFLLYRHKDAAVPYGLACAKFALNSSVDLNDSKLSRYLRLVKDHVSIVNDLGSWDKEKRAYDEGRVLYLVNTVDVVGKLFCLSSDHAAVRLTHALQLQIEIEIDDEIQRLRAENVLTDEEWRFVEATLCVMTGNIFVSTVMARYGGEASRVK
ncbi:hypothetical protein RU639_013599 [Aspergillus parasiticus]